MTPTTLPDTLFFVCQGNKISTAFFSKLPLSSVTCFLLQARGLLLKECAGTIIMSDTHKDSEFLYKCIPHFGWSLYGMQLLQYSGSRAGGFWSTFWPDRSYQRASEPQTPLSSTSSTKCQIPGFLHISRLWLPHPCSLLWGCDKQPTRWHLRPSHCSIMHLFLKQEPHYHEHFWGILEHPYIAVVGQAPHKLSLILCSAGQQELHAEVCT